MLHQTFLFLGQLWQLFEVSQILEFLRYVIARTKLYLGFADVNFVVCFFSSLSVRLCCDLNVMRKDIKDNVC